MNFTEIHIFFLLWDGSISEKHAKQLAQLLVLVSAVAMSSCNCLMLLVWHIHEQFRFHPSASPSLLCSSLYFVCSSLLISHYCSLFFSFRSSFFCSSSLLLYSLLSSSFSRALVVPPFLSSPEERSSAAAATVAIVVLVGAKLPQFCTFYTARKKRG